MDIQKYANRINHLCCNHSSNRNRYLFGYVGVKPCKVVMCLDCDRVQFVGNWFGKLIYPIARNVFRNRIEIIKTIEIDPIFDEDWVNELEKYGRDKQ